MKKLLTLIAFIFFWANANAQYVNIPDSNFRKFLIGKYPSCFNSVGQMDTTCYGIVHENRLHLNYLFSYFTPLNSRIINLDGIQYFKSLISLNCDSLYSLEIIPKFPDNLITISLMLNKLSWLPRLPANLKSLNCAYNQLRHLPPIPDSLKNLFCFKNQLTCLPLLPKNIAFIGVDTNLITCIPNKLNNCNISFYDELWNPYSVFLPICSPTNNINHCHSFPVIQSYVYTDLNSNGQFDANDQPRRNFKLTLSNNNYTHTNNNGTAYISADSLGIYAITLQAPPLYKAVPASYTHTFNSYDTLVIDTFALQPITIKDSISIKITPINWAARPGFGYVYNVNIENVGTTILNPNCRVVLDTNKYIFDSISNSNFSFIGNTLQGSFNNIYPAQNINFYVYGRIKPTTVLGSSLQATASITGGSATAVDTANTTVRGSFDPNDKQATPQLSVAQVADNKHWIDYTIRFENTGTDTAFTVVVADTLDNTKLQTNTLQLTGLSHNCKVTQNDNIVYFEFLNINLPDSNTNKTACNGFVNFRVKPLTTLIDGNIVPNKASIYFDYNSPIHTNTANTIIGSTLPLTLTTLGAIPKPENNTILVYWNTANEINTNYFIIEQSTDARTFTACAEVAAIGKGNNSYYYNIAKNNVQYIRLKMVDKNGSYSYSNIIRIPVDEKRETIVIQSPAKGVLKINVLAASLHNSKASLVNNEGKVVKTFILKQGYQTIDIAALSSGLYYVQANDVVRKVAVSR